MYNSARRPHESQSSHLTYLKEVRSVLLSSREAESFARLSAHKQVSAIKLAREHLFSACETRKATARYLPLRSIVRTSGLSLPVVSTRGMRGELTEAEPHR